MDLPGALVDEPHLRKSVYVIGYQGGLLILTSTAVIVSLWQLELLPDDQNSVYIAIESAILLLFCWLASSALILRKT